MQDGGSNLSSANEFVLDPVVSNLLNGNTNRLQYEKLIARSARVQILEGSEWSQPCRGTTETFVAFQEVGREDAPVLTIAKRHLITPAELETRRTTIRRKEATASLVR